MADQTKYNPSIAWHTIAANIYQLTRATVTDPATYQMNVAAMDSNEIGSGQKDVTCYFTDYIGNPYTIIAIGADTIDIEDSFRVGCPVTGRRGIIHKSAYKGHSLFLPSESFRGMHPIAAGNNNKFAMAILWNNDPNAKRIEFTATDTPSLTDYQTNYAEDYGETPKIQLWQIDDSNNIIERTEKPYYQLVGGLIDGIIFGTLGEVMTGFIILSK